MSYQRPSHRCLDHLDRIGVVGLTHECVVCGRLYDHLDIDDMTQNLRPDGKDQP